MCRLSQIFVIFGILGLAAVGGACQRSEESDVARTSDGVLRLGNVEVVDTVARAVAPTGRPLVLEGLRGSVHVTGADRSTADLSFVRRGRGESRPAGRSVLDGISITESGTEAEYTYTLEAEENDYAAVDIQGRVPRASALRIDRLSGSVRIDGVEGGLTIDHRHGDVSVQQAAAPVEATIRNGDLQVDVQRVPADGGLLLKTANGDIHLRLPADAAAQVDAQTDVGTIRTQGLAFTAERFAPVNAGARYDAQMGEGGPTVELRTQNGSIVIEAADTSATDTTSTRVPATVPSSDTIVAPQVDADTVETTNPDTMQADTTTMDRDTVSANP
ncbi:DUF4097 family beta strand repeat-containing protein [Salinibacter grassmerensis]|uniref:DUF4097 family beta strand repeat-containing protein n=1 Tax=Salinibacter grassmerensis TaxID=3040353 RepID=UPI0021E8545D|nr:DUF4097 family beta strand repeat-containing protein [Salinibacter grassmerensis]